MRQSEIAARELRAGLAYLLRLSERRADEKRTEMEKLSDRDPADFYYSQKTGGFYYIPTGERWVIRSIRTYFNVEQIEQIKASRTPAPAHLRDYHRGRQRRRSFVG